MCWIDWDYPQSIVTLHIYRVGRSVSNRSRISHVKIQFLSRIGLCRPVWPVTPRCKSSQRHNLFVQTPNWTFYICISIVSTGSTQWCSPIGDLKKSFWLVWPVYMTSLTGLPRLSSKPELCQFWVSTYASLFLGKACVPRNIFQSLRLH